MIKLTDLLDDIKSGEVTEVFACGTAAIITPIGRFKSEEFDVTVADGGSGKLTGRHCATSCSASSSARSKTRTTGCGRSAERSPVLREAPPIGSIEPGGAFRIEPAPAGGSCRA